MPPVPDVFGDAFSNFDLLITIVTAVLAFLIFYFYWNQDKKTETYDIKCRNVISDHEAFRAINTGIPTKLISTSDTRTSKIRAMILKKVLGRLSHRPQRVVIMESPSMEERKKVVIFENVKEIPGKSIIQRELLACLRNYFAYKLAIEREGHNSEIALHFQHKYKNYEHANRVRELDKSENYGYISLTEPRNGELSVLDDVFLTILRGADNHCIEPLDGNSSKIDKVEECQRLMMAAFFDLYSKNMKGILLEPSLDRDHCVNEYRTNIKEEDNRGYWLLPPPGCDEEEFKRFRYIGWQIEEILDEYWDRDNFSELHPIADSVTTMEYVETPFVLFRKLLEEFEYASKTDRIQGEEKFRKKHM